MRASSKLATVLPIKTSRVQKSTIPISRGISPPEPRIHGGLAEPRVGEDLLCQQRSANQFTKGGKLQAERRGQGMAQHMKTQHGPAAIPPERGRSG